MADKSSRKVIVRDFDGRPFETPVSQLKWRPSAYGIIIQDDKLLLLRQVNGYDLPGGGLELGETAEEAMIREVKEETGLAADNPRLIGIASSYFLAYKTTDKFYHGLLMYYACDYVGGELSSDGFDEAERQYAEGPEWLSLSQLENIKIGSTNDFRPYVKQALNT